MSESIFNAHVTVTVCMTVDYVRDSEHDCDG